jgi:hypothetical protein
MRNLIFLNLIFFHFIFLKSIYAQGSFLSSTILDPSISYQNWQGSGSSRNGINARLRSLYKVSNLGLGLDAEYGVFKEKFDDQRLGNTDWKQLILGVSAHYFFSGHNFSVSYSPYNRISSDSVNQYISAQTIRNFKNYALIGSSLDFQWSFPLTSIVAGHIRLLRSKYSEQKIEQQTLPFSQRTINTLFLGFSLPFRLGL